MVQRRIFFVTLLLLTFLYGCSLLPSAGDQGVPAANRPTVTQLKPSRTPASRPRTTPRPTRASQATPRPTRQPRATVAATIAAAQPQAQPIAGFDSVTPDQLPPEARDTLALIAKGGPFPYRQDGVVFQNRERLLPRKPRGYYHEYTVRTPGEDDRGARRIITGEGGEIFYTDDHYDSFIQVLAQ